MNEKQLFKFCFSAALGAGLLNAGNVAASPKATALQQAAERQVGGVVLDENGDPVIGATVTVKGQKAATVTDIDGKFSIKVPTGSTLVISYLGGRQPHREALAKCAKHQRGGRHRPWHQEGGQEPFI